MIGRSFIYISKDNVVMFMRNILSRKNLLVLWSFFYILFEIFGSGGFAVCAEEEKIDLYAQAAVLMDGDSKRILYEKNGFAPMAMASTTKIMTCALVLEMVDLDEQVPVSAYAASMPKVKMYASQGESYEVRNLLFSMMLESHNDSAVILAEYIGTTYLPEELREKTIGNHTIEESKLAVKEFANLMNRKAKELGCENTWFITPNGLDGTETFEGKDGGSVSKEHSTTAAELARILAYCIEESPGRDVFLEIARTPSYIFTENGRTITCVNHNAFLSMMDGALCGKTGFTNKAGYCYVGAVRQDGKTFIVALLGCGWPNNKTYKWSDMRTLVDYGLEHYELRDLKSPDVLFHEEELQDITVQYGQTKRLGDEANVQVEILERHGEGAQPLKPWNMLMRKGEEVSVECKMMQSLCAPVTPGTRVGSIVYSVDGKPYYTETLVTAAGIDKIDMNWCLEQIFDRFLLW